MWRIRFNIYLAALLGVLAGCQSGVPWGRKELSTLRFHYVINPDGTDRCMPITVYQANPMKFHIDRSPVLNERYVKSAKVVEHLGAYEIQVQFDRQGTWALDSLSVANRGQHIAIYSDFGQSRWLAAPLLQRRITNGVFQFTPDATRDEAERIVRGLNNLAIKERQNKD